LNKCFFRPEYFQDCNRIGFAILLLWAEKVEETAQTKQSKSAEQLEHSEQHELWCLLPCLPTEQVKPVFRLLP
jgi:hypothetical protein